MPPYQTFKEIAPSCSSGVDPLMQAPCPPAGSQKPQHSALARAANFCDGSVLKAGLKRLSQSSPIPAADLNEALHVVANRCENPDHLGSLIAHRADLDTRDGTQRTPLHSACAGNAPLPGSAMVLRGSYGTEMVKWLLEHKSSPGAEDVAGWTPLHLAASAGDAASARLLLAHGADANAKTKRGETPMQVIESTCWSGKISQSKCAQHGPVVEVLTEHQRAQASHHRKETAPTVALSESGSTGIAKENGSCRMS
eukprot:gnl/MRDRNA2_/MRDRNA2_73630_c0_seq1.p1 gnl/MRDRNA2_/MRDRNA2_73630_c0~~gnl/MRDRNA2_/MRDRNA2_73630_c0_seq1.p1  ORF type:complete len:262 (-),score=42.88 gnl/MRDRNA2_/MRDRNA2_73630_c0_seq1:69-830(-)